MVNIIIMIIETEYHVSQNFWLELLTIFLSITSGVLGLWVFSDKHILSQLKKEMII